MASLTTSFKAAGPPDRVPNSTAVVAASTTSASLLAANTARTAAYIQNRGNRDVYVTYGPTATTATGILVEAGATFFEENYTGELSVITAAGTSSVFVAEFI